MNENSLLAHIGNTPTVKLGLTEDKAAAQIWCKLEYMNPGGSAKDRMCMSIIESLEAQQHLRHGDSLVEASGGNTAISLAMISAAKGYSLTLVMPESIPNERKRLLEAYGAALILTPAAGGMKGAINKAMDIVESKKRAFMINQFDNPANPRAHKLGTAPEILRDMGGPPDMFVAGVGTGGTITGVGELFKELNPAVKIVAVEPSDSPVLSGGNPGPHRIPGIGAGFVPRVLNTDIIDDVSVVDYEDAFKAVKLLAKKEGIYAGLSSGAAVHVALRYARRLGPEKKIFTILFDAGERYVCSWP